MRPITVQVGPLAASSTTNIRTASAISGAGAVTLNGSLVSGGVATLDTPRRVLWTSAGNDSGITLTFTGTTFANAPATEVLTGSSGSSVYTVVDYKTITSVVSSGASAGNVSLGTNGIASSPWVAFDAWAAGNISFQVDVSGTANYTAQQTLDDPNSPTNSVALAAATWANSADSAVVSATGAAQSNYLFIPAYARLLLNSQTNPGFVTGTYLQAGSAAL